MRPSPARSAPCDFKGQFRSRFGEEVGHFKGSGGKRKRSKPGKTLTLMMERLPFVVVARPARGPAPGPLPTAPHLSSQRRLMSQTEARSCLLLAEREAALM